MSFTKIATNRGRQAQLKEGVGNNIFARASEFNPIVDFINSILGENTANAENIATGNSVTINANTGKITTASLSTAAGATQAITLTNSSIQSTSNVLVYIENYSGTFFTNGVPVVLRVLPAAGSATITLGNIAASNALNGTVTLKFIVL